MPTAALTSARQRARTLGPYQRAVLAARARVGAVSAETVRTMERAVRAYGTQLARAVRELPADTPAQQRQAAEQSRVLARQMADELARTAQRTVADGRSASYDEVMAVWERAGQEAARFNGGMALVRSPLPMLGAWERLAAVGGEKTWRSALGAHVAGAQRELAGILSTAIAGGVPPDELARRILPYMDGSQPFAALFAKYGDRVPLAKLRAVDPEAARKLLHNATRLAFSETHNARAEAELAAFAVDPLIEAIRWTLSPNRGKVRVPDVCDVLAGTDWQGMGAGVFSLDAVPPPPHPWDRCERVPIVRPWRARDQRKPLLTTHPIRDAVTVPGAKALTREQAGRIAQHAQALVAGAAEHAANRTIRRGVLGQRVEEPARPEYVGSPLPPVVPYDGPGAGLQTADRKGTVTLFTHLTKKKGAPSITILVADDVRGRGYGRALYLATMDRYGPILHDPGHWSPDAARARQRLIDDGLAVVQRNDKGFDVLALTPAGRALAQTTRTGGTPLGSPVPDLLLPKRPEQERGLPMWKNDIDGYAEDGKAIPVAAAKPKALSKEPVTRLDLPDGPSDALFTAPSKDALVQAAARYLGAPMTKTRVRGGETVETPFRIEWNSAECVDLGFAGSYSPGEGVIAFSPKTTRGLEAWVQGDRSRDARLALHTVLHELYHDKSAHRRGLPPSQVATFLEEGLVEWRSRLATQRALAGHLPTGEYVDAKLSWGSYHREVRAVVGLERLAGPEAVERVWREKGTPLRLAAMLQGGRRGLLSTLSERGKFSDPSWQAAGITEAHLTKLVAKIDDESLWNAMSRRAIGHTNDDLTKLEALAGAGTPDEFLDWWQGVTGKPFKPAIAKGAA